MTGSLEELASGSGRGLRQFGGNVPGKEFVDAIDGMVSDALEDVLQVGLGIKPTKLGCSDERVHAGCSLAAIVGTHEQKIPPVMDSHA